MCRLDVCKNIELDEDISGYFQLLSRHVEGKRGFFNSALYENETFMMLNKNRSLELYDKKKESVTKKVYCPNNILRIEYRLKKAITVKKFFNLDKNLRLKNLLTNSFYILAKENLLAELKKILRLVENIELVKTDDKNLWELALATSHRSVIKNYIILRYLHKEDFNAEHIRSLAKGTLTDANICNSLKSLQELKSQLRTEDNEKLQDFCDKIITNYR